MHDGCKCELYSSIHSRRVSKGTANPVGLQRYYPIQPPSRPASGLIIFFLLNETLSTCWHHCLVQWCFMFGVSHVHSFPTCFEATLMFKDMRLITAEQAKKKGRWTRIRGQRICNAILPIQSTSGRAGRRRTRTNTIRSCLICLSAGLYCW